MAYKTEKLLKQAQKIAQQDQVYFIEDVVAQMPCHKQTFYDHFPIDSDEMDAVKALLEANKIATKVKIRKKLMDGNKAPELLALYKLICTDDERKALSMQHFDHTTKGKEIIAPVIAFGDVDGRKPEEKEK